MQMWKVLEGGERSGWEKHREREKKTRAASAVQRYLGAALIIVLGWGYLLHPHRTGLYM